jgi:glycine cleavage system H protein
MTVKDLKFTDTHEWIRVEGDTATIGLTDYAQGELGDIVFVEPPEAGRELSAGDVLTTVESVKSVSEIYAPIEGKILESNPLLDDDPAVINTDPYGDGWIAKLTIPADADLSKFMSEQQYQDLVKG